MTAKEHRWTLNLYDLRRD